MGDRQVKTGRAVNLRPSVGVDFKLWLAVRGWYSLLVAIPGEPVVVPAIQHVNSQWHTRQISFQINEKAGISGALPRTQWRIFRRSPHAHPK
jgi:hypothetical protein